MLEAIIRPFGAPQNSGTGAVASEFFFDGDLLQVAFDVETGDGRTYHSVLSATCSTDPQ